MWIWQEWRTNSGGFKDTDIQNTMLLTWHEMPIQSLNILGLLGPKFETWSMINLPISSNMASKKTGRLLLVPRWMVMSNFRFLDLLGTAVKFLVEQLGFWSSCLGNRPRFHIDPFWWYKIPRSSQSSLSLFAIPRLPIYSRDLAIQNGLLEVLWGSRLRNDRVGSVRLRCLTLPKF